MVKFSNGEVVDWVLGRNWDFWKALDAYMSFQSTKERKVSRILVRLDPREGLVDMMQIQVDRYSLSHLLNYEQFPY